MTGLVRGEKNVLSSGHQERERERDSVLLRNVAGRDQHIMQVFVLSKRQQRQSDKKEKRNRKRYNNS